MKQTSREEITAFALNQGFDAYADGKLNQEKWKEYLRGTDSTDWPEWATLSKVTVVPFYDRTGLIYETLGTLNEAISQEILVTIIVVLVMVMHLRSGFIISSMLPLAVLLCFIGMKFFNVQANIVALSGIVIAIGTIVDMGIVVCENVLRHLDEAPPEESKLNVVHRAASEVGSAVLTAVMTTVVSFLPVFTMLGAEGKLFKPLAYTKTFALLASITIALTVLPAAAYTLFCGKISRRKLRMALSAGVVLAGVAIAISAAWWAGLILALFGMYQLVENHMPEHLKRFAPMAASMLAIIAVGIMLTTYWEPLGPERGFLRNLIFVIMIVEIGRAHV